jgi:hypothetical protein
MINYAEGRIVRGLYKKVLRWPGLVANKGN